MTSTSNKPFHTYENVGYEEPASNHHYAPPSLQQQQQQPPAPSLILQSSPQHPMQQLQQSAPSNSSGGNICDMSTSISLSNNNHAAAPATAAAIVVNKTADESPFVDPTTATTLQDSLNNNTLGAARILSTTEHSPATGITRMLTSKAVPGQNLVTKLITLPSQSPMDSLKEWSVSTFKCTKQFINEKRGICSITNDAQLQADIEQLRENKSKLSQMLKIGQQMTSHYTQLVRSQKQLLELMNEMSIKSLTSYSMINNNSSYYNNTDTNGKRKHSNGKQMVANFSSLSNNLSSTTMTSPTTAAQRSSSVENFVEDFLPVLNHMRSNNNVNLVDDFKRNSISLNVAIKNGEKLIAALEFYCSNLSTLINKTIEDTLLTVKQYESARLEYDAERNSLNFISPTAQTSINYSSDRLELARLRYEQSREEVQIKLRFLEENTIKVIHKQLLLFNGAFASYTSGNTAALDSTLKLFSVR